MKQEVLKPYIRIHIYTCVLWILLPLIISSFEMSIEIEPRFTRMFITILYFIYLWIIFRHFLPLFKLSIDLLLNSFMEVEIVYLNTVIYRYHYMLKVKNGIGVKSQIFLKTLCMVKETCEERNFYFYSSCYCWMKSNKTYTVVVGKHSKIVISVLSKDREEMLRPVL